MRRVRSWRVSLALVWLAGGLATGCSAELEPYSYLSFADAPGAEVLARSRRPARRTWSPRRVPVAYRFVREGYTLYIGAQEHSGVRVTVQAVAADGTGLHLRGDMLIGPIAGTTDVVPELGYLYFFDWTDGDARAIELDVVRGLGPVLGAEHLPFTLRSSGLRY